MLKESELRVVVMVVVAGIALCCAMSTAGAAVGVSKVEYLDLVEAAVAAYPEDHIEEYIDDADSNGVNSVGLSLLA